MGATTPTNKSLQNSSLSPRLEKMILSLGEFHGRGAFLIVVGHAVDPRAHGIAPSSGRRRGIPRPDFLPTTLILIWR